VTGAEMKETKGNGEKGAVGKEGGEGEWPYPGEVEAGGGKRCLILVTIVRVRHTKTNSGKWRKKEVTAEGRGAGKSRR